MVAPTDWFDWAGLVKRCMNNEALADKMIITFFAQTVTDIAHAEQAVADHDFPGLSASTHRIKGAAANLSMEQLRKVAGQIEAAAYDEDALAAQTGLLLLKSTFEQTKSLVERMSEAGPTAG